MDFRHFLLILKARFLVILFTLVVTVTCGGVLTYMAPKKYVASTFMLVNFEKGSPFDSTVLPALLSSSYLATQLDIVRSQKVALKVVKTLDLASNPKTREAYRLAATFMPIDSWIANTTLIPNVLVEPLPNSRVVSLSYEGYDPKMAATIANAYAQSFISSTVELAIEPARRNAAWFDEQLRGLRKRLETARARLTEYQLEKGIISMDEKLGSETSRLNDISKNLVDAQIATSAVRSRQLGVNHPDFVSATQREQALQRAFDDQKRIILALKSQRDELNSRAGEVDMEQQNYAATLQSYYKTVMESQFQQTNVAVLSVAVPPSDPASPNVMLNMLSATVLGLILGLCVAMLSEMVSPRVPLRKGVTAS